jgi:cytochrome c oxidase cbb3-type subunit 4
MSALSYEAVSRFAQQGGSAYFAILFIATVAYALLPRHRQAFKRLEALPLEDNEDDHVQP